MSCTPWVVISQRNTRKLFTQRAEGGHGEDKTCDSCGTQYVLNIHRQLKGALDQKLRATWGSLKFSKLLVLYLGRAREISAELLNLFLPPAPPSEVLTQRIGVGSAQPL